jgi:uncharacterized protein YjiK
MKVKMFFLIVVSLAVVHGLSGQDGQKYIHFEAENYSFPYELSAPDQTWELPKKLVEISGLHTIDDNRLACIQDEKGNIYVFHLPTGEVELKIDFGEDGDYEGVEIVGRDAWILKSNGTLYHVENYLDITTSVTTKYPTELKKKNDAEGLAYDPLTNSLLIACKGHPFIEEKEGKEFKALYKFDLETKSLDLEPFLLIEMDTIKYYKNYNTITELGIELLAYFDDAKGDLSFQPSGIAVHPLTNEFYILGSVGNLMMVFNRENKMLAMIKLRSKYYPQPEGLCFASDGTMYIANEGDDEEGTIMMFKPKKPF